MIKEKIYTIPVNDAFYAEGCECPMCELDAKTTNDLLAYYMGPSMMEPDVRIVTNKKGFCKLHLNAMYDRQENRLGLGLMLHTHISDICSDVGKKLATAGEDKMSAAKLFGGFGGKDIKGAINGLAEHIDNRVLSCAICDRLQYTMDRYIDVILWQFFEDRAFREKFMSSKGFCLPHLAMLLKGCAKYLSGNECKAFIESLAKLECPSLDIMRDEIEWFTLKFDYKNQDKPWGNSKDAVPRIIRKLSGKK